MYGCTKLNGSIKTDNKKMYTYMPRLLYTGEEELMVCLSVLIYSSAGMAKTDKLKRKIKDKEQEPPPHGEETNCVKKGQISAGSTRSVSGLGRVCM